MSTLGVSTQTLAGLHKLRAGGAGQEEEDETRILMLGLSGAGKTAILSKLNGSAIPPPGNQKFKVRRLVRDGINITAWDVGAGKYVDPYWFDHHAELVVGLVFVVDSLSDLAEAKAELFSVLTHERLARIPLLVMCNKGDCEGAISVVKTAEALELHDVKRHPHKSVRTSAVTGEGLMVGLEWLLSQKFQRA